MQKSRPDIDDAECGASLRHLSPEEMEQTLKDYAGSFTLKPSERARLFAGSVARRLHGAGSHLKRAGKRAVKHVGAKVAYAASHKLKDMAARIEQRADRLEQDK